MQSNTERSYRATTVDIEDYTRNSNGAKETAMTTSCCCTGFRTVNYSNCSSLLRRFLAKCLLFSTFASILIVVVMHNGLFDFNITSETSPTLSPPPPPLPKPKQNSSSSSSISSSNDDDYDDGDDDRMVDFSSSPPTITAANSTEKPHLEDHINAQEILLEDIKFPIKRSALVYDGKIGNVNVLLDRMRLQFQTNNVLLTRNAFENDLNVDVGHIPGVLEFDTSFFPGKVCDSFSIRTHQMSLTLNGKEDVGEEDQKPTNDGVHFYNKYITKEEIEQVIPSIAKKEFVEWKTTGVYLAPMKVVKIHVDRTCSPITDVSTENSEMDDAILLEQLSRFSKKNREIKETVQSKANILHLYKVQRRLDFGSIGFRVGALTHQTGDSPNNISRIPIPFEEFPLYGLSTCDEGVFCLVSQLGGPLLVTKYPRFEIPELPFTKCSFSVKLSNIADTARALHTMPSYKAKLTNKKQFLQSLKMRGRGGGDAPAPTLSLSRRGNKITLMPRTENVYNKLSSESNMDSTILNYYNTIQKAELLLYNSHQPYKNDSRLNYDNDVNRGTKNFRYWFVSDVQVPSRTASDDRFVYTKYRNQLVVSVPNTDGFHLTNILHPDYSDLVVFSVMKSFQPTVANDDVLGKFPRRVMSFELWHFLAHLSGVFESNLEDDTFLSNFVYEASYYRQKVRYPAQGTVRSWWGLNDADWEMKAAFFIDVFLMISDPIWLHGNAFEDHHRASLAPSQTIQEEIKQQPSYSVRRKRKIGLLNPTETPLSEDPEFSQQVRNRNDGYISDLLPDLVARCTSLLYRNCAAFLHSDSGNENENENDYRSGVMNIIPNTLNECAVPMLDPIAKLELNRVLESWSFGK